METKPPNTLSGVLFVLVIAYASLLVPVVQAGGVGDVYVTGIFLNESAHTLVVGNTDQIIGTISPSNATFKTINYVSSDSGVASVSATGLVTAIAAGTTIITATAADHTNGTFSATDNITVLAPVTLYWYSSGAGAHWSDLSGNWWTDIGHSSAALSLPRNIDHVIITGNVGNGPEADLDSWTAPASIDAGSIGISFTSASYVTNNLPITGSVTYLNTSDNGQTVTGDAIFDGDLSENFNIVTGIKTRRYRSDIATTRDFASDGPWTVLADGAKVDVSGATLDIVSGSPTLTTFSATNGGCFIGGPTPACVAVSAAPAPVAASPGGGSVANQISNLTAMGNIRMADELRAQYPMLTSQGGAVPVSTVNSRYIFDRDLTVGSVGEDVRQLQQLLNARGFSLAASGNGSQGNESNYFGIRTKYALSLFQATNGIAPVRGYFGPKTRSFVNTY